MAGEILEASKNANGKIEARIFESFRAEGVDCVSISAHWMEGKRSNSHMMFVKDDENDLAGKALAILKGQGTAEPLLHPGEKLSSYHDRAPTQNFTRELF